MTNDNILLPFREGRHVGLGTATAWIDEHAAEAVRGIRTTVPAAERPFDSVCGLMIFDMDGTLVVPVVGTPFPAYPEDRRLIAGRLEVIHALVNSGILVAIATNQGGAACGYGEPATIFPVVERFAREIGAVAAIACWSHPKATVDPDRLRKADDPFRKPNPGMLHWLMQALDVPAGRALFVGDHDEDRDAAEKVARLSYEHASHFFPRVREMLGLPADAPDPDTDPEGWLAAHDRTAAE